MQVIRRKGTHQQHTTVNQYHPPKGHPHFIVNEFNNDSKDDTSHDDPENDIRIRSNGDTDSTTRNSGDKHGSDDTDEVKIIKESITKEGGNKHSAQGEKKGAVGLQPKKQQAEIHYQAQDGKYHCRNDNLLHEQSLLSKVH